VRRAWGRQRGVSLVEALVAMAVMGFGMVALLGMQSALRGNSDISKQRSEAVRIAQERIESVRAFSSIASAPGVNAYDDLVPVGATDVVRPNVNTTFSIATRVLELPALGDELRVAPHKRVMVDVGWLDRNNVQQQLSLGTMIAAISPEIAASLSTPADVSPLQEVGGRHRSIPVAAVDLPNGKSQFFPPGAPGGVSWIFNNNTGFILQKCLGAVCVDFNGRLLSGYINFATGAVAPTGADAEGLSGPTLIGGGGDLSRVSVSLTDPAPEVVACYHADTATSIGYFCAMPITVASPYWSGRANVGLPAGIAVAGSIADNSAASYRVCRYTIAAARVLPHLSAVPPAPPASAPIRNEQHPLDYYRVKTSLTNQNFLVIRAGSGAVAFACPADDNATPDIDGSTWHHQPSN
jgi:Tfp pilus assembly protein PilV